MDVREGRPAEDGRRIWYPATVAAGLGQLVEDEETGRTRYVGLGFHDLRRANATGLVAEGVPD
jgi:hypothetical protein